MGMAARLRTMEPSSGRRIAGEIVRVLIGRKFREYDDAPAALGMSLSTFYRIMGGKNVQPLQYRKVERTLGLPTPLLDYIVAGDLAAIRALEMDADLRSFILRALQSTGQRRKNTD